MERHVGGRPLAARPVGVLRGLHAIFKCRRPSGSACSTFAMRRRRRFAASKWSTPHESAAASKPAVTSPGSTRPTIELHRRQQQQRRGRRLGQPVEQCAGVGGPCVGRVERRRRPSRRLSIVADATAQSTVYYTPFNDNIQFQGPYGLLGARVEYGPSNRRWAIAAYARNLTNTDYSTRPSGRRRWRSADGLAPRVSSRWSSRSGDDGTSRYAPLTIEATDHRNCVETV